MGLSLVFLFLWRDFFNLLYSWTLLVTYFGLNYDFFESNLDPSKLFYSEILKFSLVFYTGCYPLCFWAENSYYEDLRLEMSRSLFRSLSFSKFILYSLIFTLSYDDLCLIFWTCLKLFDENLAFGLSQFIDKRRFLCLT